MSRILAAAIDYGAAIVLAAGAWLGAAGVSLVSRPRSFAWPDWPDGLLVSLYLAILVLSLAVAWAATGRTLGQRTLGLRVVTTQGHRLGVVVALVRALVAVFFPIGMLWIAVSRDGRAVHDLLCRTTVLYDWTRHVPDRRP